MRPFDTDRPALCSWCVRRAVALLATVSLLVGACSAGAPAESDPATSLSVFWWGNAERAKRTAAALELYSTRHPGVTFTVTWQGESGYYDRLATQAVGGNAPDVFQIDDARLVDYAGRGLLLDLSDAVARGQIDVTGFPPGLADYGKVGDKVVGVAAGTQTTALVYNRSLVRSLGLPEPTTGMPYPEFMSWAARVTAASDRPVAGTADASGSIDAFWLWLRGQGRELYRPQGLGFQVDDVSRWLAMWQEARWQHATPASGPAAPLFDGDAAAAFGWSGDFAGWQARTDDELALVAYPGDPRAQWARATYYWAGFRGTRDATAVADVVDFLANDPQAAGILGTDRGFAPNVSARPADRGDKALAFENEMAGRLGPAPPPPPPAHAEITELLADAAASVAAGDATSDKAAADLVRKATAALAG